MRGGVGSQQAHVPEVFHHTEQRGNNPSDRVNVTTYVFQTNRGNHSRPQLRSMTPQPTATYYTEERLPVRDKSFGRHPSGRASNYPQPYNSLSPPATHQHKVFSPPGAGPAPTQYHFVPDADSVDDSHLQSVQASKAVFERKSWRDHIKQKAPAPTTRYHRFTNRSMTSSAPPAPGRYEFRVRPSIEQQKYGNYEVYRAVSGTAPMTLELSPTQHAPKAPPPRYVSTSHHAPGSSSHGHPKSQIGKSATLPVYQRVVPRDQLAGVQNGYPSSHRQGLTPNENETPAWYGSLRHNPSSTPAYNQQHSGGYGSLPRGASRGGAPPPMMDSRQYSRPSDSSSVFSPVREPPNHLQKLDMPHYKTVVAQPYVSANALKQSVTNAAAHKQSHGGLLKPSSGTYPSSHHFDNQTPHHAYHYY
ncbi:uncharacterized protein LOC142346234 isoform X2 [Convolutriloba macropyga]|uniref:uncharacterized protein LOC142346234 isoform X2 n=1 Tax=Convolutriloba macropyga TaxID=536237 RepID=UPI003F521282